MTRFSPWYGCRPAGLSSHTHPVRVVIDFDSNLVVTPNKISNKTIHIPGSLMRTRNNNKRFIHTRNFPQISTVKIPKNYKIVKIESNGSKIKSSLETIGQHSDRGWSSPKWIEKVYFESDERGWTLCVNRTLGNALTP